MSGPGALRFFLAPIFLWIFSLVTGSMIWFGWLFQMISSIAACSWGNSFFRCSWKRSFQHLKTSYYLRTMYLYYYYYVFCIEEICSYLSYFIMYLIVHSLKLPSTGFVKASRSQTQNKKLEKCEKTFWGENSWNCSI